MNTCYNLYNIYSKVGHKQATDSKRAKRIGYIQAFKAITIGLVIAYTIMAFLAGPLWLFQFDYMPTILFAVAMIYVAGYLFGSLIGNWIIIKKRPAVLTGIAGGFLMVWSATFAGSLVGFFNEGLGELHPLDNPFYDYIYKPLALVTIFGCIPILLVGIWFGISIKRKFTQNKQTAHYCSYFR